MPAARSPAIRSFICRSFIMEEISRSSAREMFVRSTYEMVYMIERDGDDAQPASFGHKLGFIKPV
jgi:hypothetical protein